ncbi:MAG: hypothetical protein IT497_06120 [Ottowia sp.]|nr:hypothetical protein [Ottowia sp.]
MLNILKANAYVRTLSIGLLLVSTLAYGQPTYPEVPPYEERGYDYSFTFKYGQSFTRDPWVWAYTTEFAERFHMPKQWVEPELKGLLAVAFRMNRVGNDLCGLGGRADNCWPHLECQMDIYYDNSIKLPWNRPDISEDFFMNGISSTEFVDEQLQNKLWKEKYHHKGGTGVGFSISINEKKIKPFSKVMYYKHLLFPGVGLIGVQGASVCPYEIGPATGIVIESFLGSPAAKEAFDKAYKHQVQLPESFIRRAHEVYARDDQQNKAIKQRLLQDFMKQKK